MIFYYNVISYLIYYKIFKSLCFALGENKNVKYKPTSPGETSKF